MKSRFFYFSLFSLIVSYMQAQELHKLKANSWGWGVFAGATLNHPLIQTQFPEHFKPFFGTQAGVDVRYRLDSRASLHLQPTLAHVSNKKLDDAYLTAIYDLVALKIPLSYRYYVIPNKRTLFIEAGASYNQLVKTNYQENLYVVCIVGPCPAWYTPELPPLTKLAVSGFAGVGIDIDINKVTIPILLRYEREMTNYVFPRGYADQTRYLRFQSIALTTGVSF